MSDAEDERYGATSLSRTDGYVEVQDEQGGSRPDSGRKHKERRRRAEEDEEEEEADEEGDGDEEDDDDEDDEEGGDEGLSRGSKRQKVCRPILHGCTLDADVVASADTNVLLLTVFLMSKPR